MQSRWGFSVIEKKSGKGGIKSLWGERSTWINYTTEKKEKNLDRLCRIGCW